MTNKLAQCSTAVLAVAVCLSTTSLAVSQKLLKQIGVDNIDPKISTLVNAMMKPAGDKAKGEFDDFISAGIALMLFLAIASLLYALVKVMMGSRGGGERLAAVIGGMIAAIACVQILA